MKFQEAKAVRSVIERLKSDDITLHQENRAKVIELFEGFPPFTEQEVEENHIGRNVNFLEAPSIAHKARSTWNNALLKPGNYAKVTLDSGPIHKRSQYAASITKNWNRAMKGPRQGLRYIEATRATGAQVIMHGIGPKHWSKAGAWCPHEVGLEDLLVPIDTRVNLENLSNFAIFRKYTPEELYRMTHGRKVDPGWKMGVVNKELQRLATSEVATRSNYDLESPEKLARYYKANSGLLDTDIVPTSNVWDFFYQDQNDPKCRWYRKVILENGLDTGDDFIYETSRPYAGALSQILHIQFGDGAQTAPFLYHSVRSLGFLLFAICQTQNQLRCRFMDAIFEATMQYFRSKNDEDRARVGAIDLQHLGLWPSGIEAVKPEERWQINENLVIAGLSQNRQLMSENAAAFVQDVDQGTQKELTATEVMARLNNANALVSSLLSMAYTYHRYELIEIARRFCLKDTQDPDIESFRLGCLRDGVPELYLNSERWMIEPERVLGGGNKTLELAQAESLMNRIDQFDSEAQLDIRREWVLAVTDNPDQAEHWVPRTQKQISNAGHDAQLAVGALMMGAPVATQSGIDHIAYVDAMLQSMQSIVDDILVMVKQGHQPMPQQVVGLVNCYRHILGHIAIVAKNEAEKSRVKDWGDKLKPLMNYVKAWGQQIDQAHEASQQQNGDGGKMMATVIGARSKAKIAETTAAQRQRHKEIGFQQEQRRRNVQTMTEAGRQRVLTAAQVEAIDKKTAADVRKTKLRSLSEE